MMILKAVLALICVTFCTGNHIKSCYNCFEHGKIWVRTLFSYSNFTSYCLNYTNELPYDSLPVWRACAWYECECAYEPNSFLNRSTLCMEQPYHHCNCSQYCKLVPSHTEFDSSGGENLFKPVLFVMIISFYLLFLP